MLASGTRLGPYEIVASIGKGGMGEVFRARDTSLARDVAIKVLPAEFAKEPDRVTRFRREAHILASLNHPNIAAIYGLEETPEPTRVIALVMEYVEGEDLEARLKRGAVPLDESIAIAKQIADALEEAHERGIIHRDLKPANVKVTPEGKVKVLDFGLAKAMDVDAGPGGGADHQLNSPTMTHQGTAAGVILGTAAYMSPEQARGRKLDKRSDIWSFGVVLFEILIGRRLFDGETVTDVLAAVLTGEIDWSRLPAMTPAPVVELLRRCLDRNPKNRLHDIGDARFALEQVMSGGSSSRIVLPAPPPSTSKRFGVPVLAALLVLAFAIGVALGRGRLGGSNAGSPRTSGQFELAPPAKTQFLSGLAISQDGDHIAYVARAEDGRTHLYVRAISDARTQEIPGSVDALYPFWAPDGRRVGFFSLGRLRIADLLGGTPRVIAETGSGEDARGAAWGADDRIVFAPSYTGPLRSVAATGGEVIDVTKMVEQGEGTHRFPGFLSDGRRFVFYGSAGTGVVPGSLFLGRLGGPLQPKRLGAATSSAVYVDPGYLLYVQGDSLVAHRFDDDKEELEGDPIPLGVSLPGSVSIAGQRSLSVSRTGILAYRVDKRNASRLVWVDRAGKELQPLSKEDDTWHYAPTISPDGRRLAVSHYEADSTGGSVWVHDLERGLASRLSADEKDDDTVVAWSPDSQEVAYATSGEKGGAIMRASVNQAGRPTAILETSTYSSPTDWLPDGRLLYVNLNPGGRASLYLKSLTGADPPRALGDPAANEYGADAHPNGQWMAFHSDPTRHIEVYVRRLDDTTGSSTIRVSENGGTQPRWRSDGRELFFVADTGKLMSVPVLSLDPFKLGTAVPLFDANLEHGPDRQYDVSRDGKRFLLNRALVSNQVPVSIITNWRARLSQAKTP